MFNRTDSKIPLLIRMVIGRGWGQGPTHSQSFHSMLASIPGLDIYYPYSPETAYSDILYGLSSGNPTIVFEHRWLYGGVSSNFTLSYPCARPEPLTQLRSGSSFTIATYGYLVPLVLQLHSHLSNLGITFDLFVFNSISFHYPAHSLERLALNKRLLLLDSYYCEASFLASVLSDILSYSSCHLDRFRHVGLPFEPESTSYYRTQNRYFSFQSLVDLVSNFIDNPSLRNSIDAMMITMMYLVPGSQVLFNYALSCSYSC